MSYTPYTGSTNSPNGPEEPPRRRSPLGLIVSGLVLAGLILGIYWYLIIWRPPHRSVDEPIANTTATSGLPTVAVPLPAPKVGSPAPKVGSPAPDFELVDLNTGQPLTLSSLKGKPVWINFWATWCPPCKEEMPVMQDLYEEHKDKGLVILGVDVQEPESDVSSYIKQGSYSWTFVIDTTGKIADSYHVGGLPSHYFVDKDGLIQAIVIGGLKSEMTGEIRDITPFLEKIMP